MKPVRLIICGWGPYKEKAEIDFAKFHGEGQFLITGSTGAGKTTIFDAISYALYGEVSGGMRSKDSVRSDFADADTKTYVELEMTHDGRAYRITRNPQYLRPKKRKSGTSESTKESENAILQMPDGRIIEGNKEVNRKVQEILAMGYEQFKQISMIAQGEFTKLLTVSSKEKTQIFRDIFGTHIYERFASILHQRAAELSAKIMTYHNKMDESIETLKLDDEAWKMLTEKAEFHYVGIRDYLKEELFHKREEGKVYAGKQEEADSKVLALLKRIEEAENGNRLLLEQQQAEHRKEELEAQKSAVRILQERLQLAMYAEKAEGSAIRFQEAKKRVLEIENKLYKLNLELQKLKEDKTTGEELFSYRTEIRQALETWEELNEKRKSCTQKEKTLSEKQRILLHHQEQYMDLEKEVQNDKKIYEEADLKYRRAMVGIVAKQVKKGEPCPVCGSVEHPQIAVITDEVPNKKTLKDLRAKADKNSEKLLTLQGIASACKGEKEAEEAGLETLQQEILLKEKTMEEISDIIKRLMKDLIAENGEKALWKLEQSCQKTQFILAEIEAKRGLLQECEAEKETQMRSVEQMQLAYQQKLQECQFVSEEQYLQSKLDVETMNHLREQTEDYAQQVVSNADHRKRLIQAVKGRVWISIEELQMQKVEAEQDRSEVTKKYQQLQLATLRIKETFHSLQDKLKEIEQLEREYGIVKDLDNITMGNNPKRLVFEQYVLINYFNQVLKAANVRFRKMTLGRYELSRAEQTSDGRTKDNFEIQVLDHYTGKYRLAKTLSGGETFKASLSLALGMSDIIQANSGGVKVETLFIDEGFGSLDAESLDQACETLTTLVEKNRFVGIISHVAELRERIEKQIVIEKTNVGSHIKTIA